MKDSSKKPVAYSYRRWSTEKQTAGSSEHRQTKELDRFCEYNGLKLAEEEFVDSDISSFRGSNARQGALKTFLDAVKSGTIQKGSWLIIDSFDRLSRQKLKASNSLVSDILESGITIGLLSTGEVFPPDSYDDVTNIIRISLALDIARKESENRAHRSAGAWDKYREDIADGKKPRNLMGGICPNWIDKSGGEYKLIPERAKIVERIYQLYIDGNGAQRISSILNSEGVEGFKGKKWSTATISKILIRRTACGYYSPANTVYEQDKDEKGKVIKDSPFRRKIVPTGEEFKIYPSAIPEEMWERANAVRKGKGVSVNKKDETFRNVFQNLAFCPCGTPLRLTTSRGKTYSICRSQEYGQVCGHRKSIRFEQLKDIVFTALVSEEVVDSLLKHSKGTHSDSRLKEAEGRLAASESKLKSSLKLLEENIDDIHLRKAYAPRVSEAQKAVDEAKAELSTIKAEKAHIDSNSTEDFEAIVNLWWDGERGYYSEPKIRGEEEARNLNQVLRRHFKQIVWSGVQRELSFELKHSGEVITKQIPADSDKFSLKPFNKLFLDQLKDYAQGNGHLWE